MGKSKCFNTSGAFLKKKGVNPFRLVGKSTLTSQAFWFLEKNCSDSQDLAIITIMLKTDCKLEI